MSDVVLEVRDLYAQYGNGSRRVKAVDGVSFSLRRGGVLALVGESGCGKTTIALSILGLLPYPGRVVGGEVRFEGNDLLSLRGDELRRLRGREISMIFQDPVSGLNPVLSVGEQVEEIIAAHTRVSKQEARRVVEDALQRVGLAHPERLVKQYPYQLSGGMSQRVFIAIATVLNPKVVIADEPTSALDVTVQAGILNELERLRREQGVSILLITHDLGVVAQMADEVAVMYAGRIAEQGRTRDVLRRPRHPYTWSLLATLPRVDQDRRPLEAIQGSPPDLAELPDECAFLPRCRKAVSACRTQPSPPLAELAPGQRVACYNPVYHPDE
ncbi:MAG: methionine ABC transporter ATP-binding protein [Chloroflexi bacterium RBG_16_68_14]|nr:MAG: methionine ABC transporter ATP-binding protein [Chloroflexi bacterium RBG_16_68_14]